MMRNRAWLVFALVFAWKVILFVFTAQPIPANDAFFYDGAVIHHLLHGGYYNPCIAPAFPVSGTEVFSAYPPLYQLVLWLWMLLWGTSALSSMALHLVLFGIYMLVLLAIFRRLQIAAWCVNVTGVFLLIFTFHDRPDSVAHVLGVLAIYCCVRSRRILGRSVEDKGEKWTWRMAVCIVLAFCASLQIGGIYFLVVSASTWLSCFIGKEKFPVVPWILMAIVPAFLAGLVVALLPRPWAGFMENVRQTPFITGLRLPHWQEIAKIIRTVPAILMITAFLPISWFKQHRDFESDSGRRQEVILLSLLFPALGIIVASLSILSPNTVAIANYLQPMIIASYLALIGSLGTSYEWRRFQVICLVPIMLLGSVRAVGMTTWGWACANDMGYAPSNQRVEKELVNHPKGYKVVMSSAFLYGAARHDDITFYHSDWMTKANGDSRLSDVQALQELKPEKMILTQYDYYRRFQGVLEQIKPGLVEMQTENTARLLPPDAYKSVQQIVQHISWAPVIIHFSWRDKP